MCCLTALVAIIGPRLGIVVWWLAAPTRWDLAFDGFWAPLLGFLFLPWTTIMWVAVFTDGVRGFEWILIGLGVAFDVFAYSGGGYTGRQRYYTA